jgi:hypothetical protein
MRNHGIFVLDRPLKGFGAPGLFAGSKAETAAGSHAWLLCG